jgi:hypothetical protein
VNPSAFSVEMDGSRGMAVFVDSAGERLDILAVDEDGNLVACAEPSTVVTLPGEPAAKGFGRPPVMVAGMRGDGTPGLWIITPDNKVQLALDAETGKILACLPDSDERDGTFRGRFGWVYRVMGVSEDGRLIAGIATHEMGFTRGRWKIEPGTTIGVYWRVWKHASRPFWVVSRARIIGTYEQSRLPLPGRRNWILNNPRHFKLLQLKWFMLDYLSAYLVLVEKDGVHKDPASDAYLVSGTDQDGAAAVATIAADGRITIQPAEPPSDLVDLAPGALTATGPVPQGGSLPVSVVVRNLQPGPVSAPFAISVYAAAAAVFAPSTDTLLATVQWSGGVAGNSSAVVAASVPVPASLPAGSAFYVYAVLDSAGTVAETDETNNQSSMQNSAVVLVFDGSGLPQSYAVSIETYPPTGTGSTDTVMALYRKDSSADSASIVLTDLSGGSDYALLDFTAGGLASGTYYVMVYSFGGRNGPYAFTVRTTNIARPSFPNLPSNNVGVDPGEPDDTPQVTDFAVPISLPTSPMAIGVGQAVNRYSGAADWDWFTFTLP